MQKPIATIYTDGACMGNPGPGGFAAIVTVGDETLRICGGSADTTNNRMELMAVIHGLRLLTKCSYSVVIYSDSRYITNAFQQNWVGSWRTNGWERSNGELKNKDLWICLADMAAKHDCQWKWVKGHNGDKMNELADKLACEQRDLYSSGRGSGKAIVTYLDGTPLKKKDSLPGPIEEVIPGAIQDSSSDDEMSLFDDGYYDGEYLDDDDNYFPDDDEQEGVASAGAVNTATLQFIMEFQAEKEWGVLKPCGMYSWCQRCAGKTDTPCADAFIAYRTCSQTNPEYKVM